MSNILYGISSAYPEILLSLGAMALMMVGAFFKEVKLSVIAKGAMLYLLAAGGLVLFLSEQKIYGEFLNGLFVFDEFAVFCKVAIALAAFLVLRLTINHCEKYHQNFPFEYPILILLSVCGMFIMVSSANFLSLYLGLELQSLALYVLAAIDRHNSKSSEAGVKYFVLGALASGILLYGISLIYGFAGTTNFAELNTVLANQDQLSKGLIVGLVLVIVGFAFKISAAPFHMWTPDVYEGVPTPVTAYFAIVPKLAVVAMFVRVLSGAFGAFVEQWQDIIVILSLLSMSVGAFAGIWQGNIKRLLAYSSIGNMGYALIGIAAYSENGISATLVFLAIYMLVSVAIFAIIMSVDIAHKDGNSSVEQIVHLAGLARSNPFVAALLALAMFSMIGLPFPPFAGFFGKFFIFKTAIDAHLYGLAVFGVVASVVAAFYYLRIVKVMYFDKLADGVVREVELSRPTKLVLAIVIAANLLIFLQPNRLLDAVPAIQIIKHTNQFSTQQI